MYASCSFSFGAYLCFVWSTFLPEHYKRDSAIGTSHCETVEQPVRVLYKRSQNANWFIPNWVRNQVRATLLPCIKVRFTTRGT